jgi:hypothetical protein
MQNLGENCSFDREDSPEQNWTGGAEEQARQWQWKRDICGKERHLILPLKAVFAVLCVLMLHSLLFETDPLVYIVNIELFGILALVMVSALIFLSGRAALESFWGQIDRRRQELARHDSRFKIERIVIAELWVVYAVLSWTVLRSFVFSDPGLPRRFGGIVLFGIFTSLMLVAVILLSDSRSYWGRMKRFVLKEGAPRNTSKR